MPVAAELRCLPAAPGCRARERCWPAPAGTAPFEAMVSDERLAWDRRSDETARAYDAFRRFRDAGPLRNLRQVADATATSIRSVARWSEDHRWFERAVAWDDEVHATSDKARLEAIRTMHDNHQRAGRAVMGKALAALNKLDPEDIPAYAAARLLELGARLERDTLLTSVEELQGAASTVSVPEDPWEAIARELTGSG